MKKHFFDPGLYLDALRQLRFIGLSGALLLCLEAVIIPIGILISNRRSESYGSAFVQSVDGMSMHPLLILTYCVMAPLMMLYLFQFLNKRAASDFYHAIPNSRVSLFFSFFAAVMTWLAAAAVVSTLLSLAGFLLLGPAVAVNGFSLLILLFNSMAACLFVCGAVAVAMCVTGTLFTNVTVSLLIIFMPRLLLAVFCSTLQEMLPMISSLYFIPPLDSQYNVVTNLLFGAFNGNADLSFTFLGGGIYTLSIGALYTGLASWLFYRRKSETAGKAAPNRALQTLYRLLVSMLVCLFPCVFIASAILNREALDGESLFTYAVFYLGAVLVYFLYELFTTRKWRNLLRAVPALGILLLMNAAFTGGIVAAYYSTLDIRPQAGDMEAVRFINRSDNDYFSIKTSTVKIRDPAMQEIVAQRLNYTLELAKDSPQAYYDAQNDLSMTAQQVAVYLPGRTLYRNLLFSSRDLNDIAGILGENPTYREAYQSLPEHPSVSVYGLNAQQAADVYAVMRREIAGLDFAVWYRYLQSGGEPSYYRDQAYRHTGVNALLNGASVRFSGSVGARSYSTSIPLDPLLPETCALYMRYANENAGPVLETLQGMDWTGAEELRIQGYRFAGLPDRSKYFSRTYTGDALLLLQDELRAWADSLENMAGQPPSLDRPLYAVSLTDGSGVASLYINAPDDTLPDFIRQYGEQ